MKIKIPTKTLMEILENLDGDGIILEDENLVKSHLRQAEYVVEISLRKSLENLAKKHNLPNGMYYAIAELLQWLD